jgi:deoxycytidylate deaminase
MEKREEQVFPELIFGLVGAIGTDLDQIQEILGDSLKSVGYEPVLISLAEHLKELKRSDDPDFPVVPDRSSSEYYDLAIKRGNYFRKTIESADAVVTLGLLAIQVDRAERQKLNKKRAYIIRSLKRKEEVELLRSIYGSAAVIVSVYAPRERRVDQLAEKIATSVYRHQIEDSRGKAEVLVQRDEDEKDDKFGQRVRRTFPLADFFVEVGSEAKTRDAVQRFVELLFGNLKHTPFADEQGMAMAHLARVRSASPARQVGAAITDAKGRVLSVGTNEVPKAGGGQYWQGDDGDGRDYEYSSIDLSDKMRQNLLGDLLGRMEKSGLLAETCPPLSDLLSEKKSESPHSLRESLIFDTIDFVRAVHAEASAILNLRVPPGEPGMTLYVTTFPCHECARHIVICGIQRVMYIEPYPKSLVHELYDDSISLDPEHKGSKVRFISFVGIAPSLYMRLFEVGERKRKNEDGKIIKWNPRVSFPQLLRAYSEAAARVAEEEKLKVFRNRLSEERYS